MQLLHLAWFLLSIIPAIAKNNKSDIYPTVFDGVTWDNTKWRLRSAVLDQGHYQSRGSVANGYIGINVASAGPFFELDVAVDGDVINGWPLFSRRQTFAGLAGFWDSQPTTNGSNFPWLYQYGGESPISGIPHWGSLILDLGNGTYLDATVDNRTISNYETVYDYKAGVLSWSYTWTPSGYNGSFEIAYSIFANKLNINEAVVNLNVRPSSDGNATVVNLLEGYAGVRTSFVHSGRDGNAIFSAVRPSGVTNVTAFVYAIMEVDNNPETTTNITDAPYILGNASTIAEGAVVQLKAGQNLTVSKFVGIASTDAFGDPQQMAKNAATKAQKRGYTGSLKDHTTEWATIFPSTAVDDFALANGSLPGDPYIIESAIMAVVNPYYLLQNTIGPNAQAQVGDAPVNEYSISVGGLSSDSYAGLVFWDADVWMAPGLVAAFPESAQRITNYRVAQYPQAKNNVKTAYQSSKNGTHFSSDAALYPWTSGRYGNCTATGPCFDYEYHLNGDIGLALVDQWLASGDNASFAAKYFPVYNSIATAFGDLVVKNGSSYTLTNMTDPDEYANNVDAGGFTMPLISQTLSYANAFRSQLGMAQNDTWNDIAANVLVLRESDVTLEYTTMNNSVEVKQADVVLDVFPLDYTRNYAPSNGLNDLDYYAAKQSPDGPGMTYAIFSIVANEVSESGCSAHTYQQYSYQPYLRGPFHQLSEQLTDDFTTNGGTHPAFPFLTGHGGANQAVLYGYLGLRYLPSDSIYINPNLPPQVPEPITAKSNYTHTTIARSTEVAALSTANSKYNNTAIPLQVGGTTNKTYSLSSDGKAVVVKNRKVGSVNTVTGNLVQCQPASSPQGYEPGQFPLSVNDGAASTKWQPVLAKDTSSVTVTIPSKANISGFYFNWAQLPPVNASVVLHNASNVAASAMSSGIAIPVNISDPWSAQSSVNYDIGIQIGNTTNYTLPNPVPATRYATLFISGNQGLDQTDVQYGNGTGATVAEWAIISN